MLACLPRETRSGAVGAMRVEVGLTAEDEEGCELAISPRHGGDGEWC